MRKDILWEPFFFLANHLKLTSWSEYYNMPVRLRNWLVERTIQERKAEHAAQEAANTGQSNLDGGGDDPGQRAFKDFRAF